MENLRFFTMIKVKCMICEKEFGGLALHLLKKHNIKCKEYLKEYPNSPIQSPDILNKARANSPILKKGHPCYCKNGEGQWKKGHLPWNAGLTKNTDCRLEIIAEKSSCKQKGKKFGSYVDRYGFDKAEEIKNKISLGNTNKVRSEETKQKISKTRRLKILSGELILNSSITRFKAGFRSDLNHFVRSSWEANICRVLKYNNKDYEYESRKCRFDLDELGIIIIDLFIPKDNLYIEVKGRLKEKSKLKMKRLISKYPDLNLKVIDGEVYNDIKNKYRSLIEGWEK
jgi:hypothetical protein